MAKPESNLKNMTLTLLVITAVASVALGLVYNATMDVIAQAKVKQLNSAIADVIPAFDKIDESVLKPDTGKDDLICYEAFKNEQLIGIAIKTYTDNGFSGRFWIIVGFDPEGKILNYNVLEHKETPGLGDKMTFWFKDSTNASRSIIGKSTDNNNLTVKKDGGEVDAITASTISSRAFLDAVNRAWTSYKKNKK